jgi:anti-anti-sigma factor
MHGRVDAFTEKRTTDTLGDIVGKISPRLAIDLHEAEFLSLSMLRFLVSLKKNLVSQGGDLVLVNPNHHIKRQIEIFVGPKSLTWVKQVEEIPQLHFKAMLQSQYQQRYT